MDQKKMATFRQKLLLKKQEILETFTKNKSYGMEAGGESSQDIADKAANSYTKEFLFSLSNSERQLLQQVDNAIARIDPLDGSVTGLIDLSGLYPVPQDQASIKIPNGIAYDQDRDRLLVTGKWWSTLFEIELVPAP